MAKKIQHSVRWEGWIANAIDAWAKENGNKTFSDSVNYLLACELERWGYKRMHYEPGILETPPSTEIKENPPVYGENTQKEEKLA
jgi:hypothetical protein